MTAYEFIGKMLVNTPSHSSRNVFSMQYAYDTISGPQWINTNYCKVTSDKVILGVSVVEDDPEENYIDTLFKLKQYFLINNIKRTHKMYISSESGEYPIKDFDVKIGATPNECNIICH